VITPAVTPTRQSSNTTDYTFAGWNPTIAPVTKDQTYTATYSESDRTYTVNFYEEDGETFITSIPNLKYTENFNNRVPADRDDYSDNEYNYTFAGWERMDDVEQDSFPVCMGDANYKAKFSSSTRKYIVKFYNVLFDENGNTYNVLWDEQEYEYNEDIVDPEDDPSRPSDDTYNYIFKGWYPDRGKVTTDGLEFFADYEYEEIPYTVRFEYYKDKFSSVAYKYGAEVKNEPSAAEVARPADETYTWDFKGWAEKKEGQTEYTIEDVRNTTVITSATKTVTYVAVYEPTYIDYTILFVNGETVLQGQDKVYHWDDTVKYEGAVPTKGSSDTTEYTFSGWSPAYSDNMAVSSITNFDENRTAVFTAQFSESTRLYKISFVDSDGTPIPVSKNAGDEALAVNEYEFNATVTKPANPTPKNSDTAEWDYYFAGWTPEVTAVTGDQVYTATYDRKKQEYVITFEQYDGYEGTKIIKQETLKYGDPIVAPTTGIAIQPADDMNTYDFGGWNPNYTAGDTVVGDATYVAVMDPTPIEYTILFVNGDKVLQGDDKTYHWNQTVTYVGGTPTKSDMTYTYTFAGWKNANSDSDVYSDGMNVSSITFNDKHVAVFEAQFTTEHITYHVKFSVVDGDTKTLVSDQYGNYEFAVTLPETPAKDSLYRNNDVNDFLIESYEFDGWYLDGKKVGTDIVDKATGNIEYLGYFTPVRAKYNVKFIVVDVDGKENTVTGYDQTLPYGDKIAIPKVGLETEANVDVISKKQVGDLWYQVTGWTPEIVTVCEGTAVYKCSYVIDPGVTYEVTFVFNNGDPDFSTRYAYGKEITVPADPVKTDKVNTYVFTGWTPEFPVNDDGNAICVGPKTYYAEYASTPIDYEVSFIDEDNTPILVSKSAGDDPKAVNLYHYGDTITEPKPVKGNDETYTYKFVGWVNTAVSGAAVIQPDAVPACTESVTYKAVYEPDEFVLYTVVFEDENYSFKRSGYHYNDEIVVPDNRSKERDDKYDYTFIGWAVKTEDTVAATNAAIAIKPLTGENDPVYNVTENITYVAVYKPSLRVFNVYFVDDNRSDLGQGLAYKVTWGETIKTEELAEATGVANGAADLRSRVDCQYFFAGWTNADKEVVGPADTVIKADTTFYASYSRQYKFSFYYHGSDASTYGKTGEVLFTKDSVKEGESYDVIKNGPTLASTPTTKYDFIGWSLEQIDPEVLPDYLEKKAMEDQRVNVVTIQSLAGAVIEDVYVNRCIVTLCADTILSLGENEDGTTRPIDLYPVFAASPVYYTVIFQDADGTELAKRTDFIYNEPALDLKPADPKGWVSVSGYTTTTYTFKNWSVSDAELAAVTKNMVVTAQYDVKSVSNPPVIIITPTPSPTPTATPTPTPIEEEIIETPETPQGPVEEEPEEEIIPPQPETPQGAPEEEVDLDDVETPQGDLPKTGTTPTVVFFGLGAACIMLGGVMLKGIRRREDEM